MHTLNPSEAEIQELRYERFHYPCPIVQKRMHCVYLKCAFNFEHKFIAAILDRHPNTVTTDILRYQSKGIEGLKQVNYGTNKSELDTHAETIKSYFKKNPPASTHEAIHRIKELTGIQRSPTQTRAFLKRIGMKFIKTGHVPAKADPEKQEQWLENTLTPAIELAKQGQAHLLFMDAAHMVLAPFLCWLWCFSRVFIKAPAGRKRVNVLGAVNALTQHIHFTTKHTYINAVAIVEFLHQVRLYYLDFKPIYIVLDNARYQHCNWVKEVALQLNIKLLFMPPYSPNLNIIERLWRFLKKKCLYAQYYETFDEFKNAIVNTLNKANSDIQYIDELKKLLSLKFQRF